MLFLEIFLTITAWQRGFKGWALLPLGLAMVIGFMIGASSLQTSSGNNFFGLIWIDILAIVVLIGMIAVGTTHSEAPGQEPGQETEDKERTELPEH